MCVMSAHSSRPRQPTSAAASKEMLLSMVRRRNSLRGVRLGTLLVAAKLATQEQIDKAIALQASKKARLGSILTEMGVLTEAKLNAVLDHQFGPVYVDVARYPVNEEAVGLLSPSFAHKMGVLPIDAEGGVLYLATTETLSADSLRLIAYTAQMREVFCLRPVDAEQLPKQLSRLYTRYDSIVFAAEVPDEPSAVTSKEALESSLRILLAYAVSHCASDIHIGLRKGYSTSTVMLRVDGTLVKFRDISADACMRLVRQLETLSGMGLRRPQDAKEGRMSFYANGAPIDVRISIIPSAVGTSVVMRILDARNFHADIKHLNLPADQEQVLLELIERPHGLMLMTGPTGSGKTSTLYTILKHIQSKGGSHITTVEDPVEYILPGVSQFNTTNFALSLKQLLRHDPDVIMVGEMRDADSGLAATNAAITGHFVMATLHANNSVSAVHRMLALGIPAVLIASSLIGVLSQRLARLKCMTCHGAGCNSCRQTGYAGRRLVLEMVRPKPSFASMLNQTSTCDDIANHMEFVGLDLDRALVALGMAGLTDWNEVRSVVADTRLLPPEAYASAKR